MNCDGAGGLASSPTGAALPPDPSAVDAVRFERLAGDGRRRLVGGEHAEAAEALSAGLELWRGPAYVEFPDVAAAFTTPGTVDGELLVKGAFQGGSLDEGGGAASFNALQQRLGRKNVSTKVQGQFPAFVRLYDILFDGDEDLLTAALRAGAGYVGLVASARRATSVLAGLRDQGLGEEEVLRVRAPAGLDLGPSTQEEIAVAILAELVAWRHTRGPSPAELVEEAVDPVCGMTVAVAVAKETAVRDGVTYYFCSAHCRKQFEAAPV